MLNMKLLVVNFQCVMKKYSLINVKKSFCKEEKYFALKEIVIYINIYIYIYIIYNMGLVYI